MDPKTTTPAVSDRSDPLAAMFQNATIDKAEKSEFSNSARDMFKFAVNNYFNFAKEGENMVLESCDVLDYFRNAVQPFLAEVRKNDQSRSTVGDMTSADGNDPVSQVVTTGYNVEGDPVDVVNLVPQEPSSLPVASVADRYTRSMLMCLAGYPLYEPQPLSELSTEYLRNGVNIGDVGYVRRNGTFDFLFNVCPPKNALINPPNLPEGFSLEAPDHSATTTLLPTNCLFQSPVTRTKSGEYICEGSEGAVLELPEGAIEEEAMNILPFSKLAARHGVQWYEYTMSRGRDVSNGSLYLITSSTKCIQWGIAVFDRPCDPGQGLKFDRKRSLPFGKSTSKYHWRGSRAFPTKVSNLDKGDAQNQCVFVRGYKIMIRQDIFDNLCNNQLPGSSPPIPSSLSQAGSISVTRQPATRIRGGGGSDPMSKRPIGGGLLSWTTMSTVKKSDKVVLHPNFNSSLVHPSDLINAALLNQNPDAKVALIHDDVWCDLLRNNFPKLNYATLVKIAQSYTNAVDEYDCVTLEKMSGSSSVLDESNSLIQGTEISAFQAPLTTREDDYTPLFITIAVTLPLELVERILLLLDTKSMLMCRLANREFNEIIQSSTLLQYFLACKAASVVDNSQSPLSNAERLEALKKREDAWRMLKPVFETTISIKCQSDSQICRSNEGVFFLSDRHLKDLDYCHLTSFPQDNLRWTRTPGHGPALNWSGTLINSVAVLYEHDLIINLISSDVENQTGMHSLDLVLLKFSTGEYHPLARHPRIHIQRSAEVNPWGVSRVVGDNLALIVQRDGSTFADTLVIFDWKTGRKLLQHEAPEEAYFTLEFISPELLLVPNMILSHFEIWHLSSSCKPPVQILSLQIPAISPQYSIQDIGCYGAPSPIHNSMPYLPPWPFFSSPENSIIVFKLRISSNSRLHASYDLIMHRRAILDTIQKWTSPSLFEQQESLPMWLTNEVTVRQIADPEDGSVDLVESKLVSTEPHPRSPQRTPDFRTSPTSHISADTESPSTSRCTFLQVPWEKWGPPISRWFEVSGIQVRWRSYSNGQRYAFSEPNPLDPRKLMVSVADFNPHNVKRNEEMMARLRSGEGEGNGSNKNNEQGKKEEELEVLDHKGVFSEEVYMGLKCAIYRAPDEYDFDVVMMDEQRLFGVKCDRNGWEEIFKVFYIG